MPDEDSEDEERAKQAVDNLMRQFPEPVLNGRMVARPYDDDEQLSESSSSSDSGELMNVKAAQIYQLYQSRQAPLCHDPDFVPN